MKFSLFMTLLDFTPDRIYLYSKEKLIGDYRPNQFRLSDKEVQNMEVEIIKIDRERAKIELEVIK